MPSLFDKPEWIESIANNHSERTLDNGIVVSTSWHWGSYSSYRYGEGTDDPTDPAWRGEVGLFCPNGDIITGNVFGWLSVDQIKRLSDWAATLDPSEDLTRIKAPDLDDEYPTTQK